MRVTLCVDALTPNPGGIGRYTRELCKGLAGRDEIAPLHFFARNRLIDDPIALLRRDHIPPVRTSWLQRWRDKRAIGSSIVHGPNYFLPAIAETGVITVHDLSVFRFPETHPAERVNAFEREFTNSLSRAAHVITDTETIRVEVIEMFSLRPDSVTAIHLGVDQSFRPRSADEVRPILAQCGLEPGGYGLCVSTLEPRKKIAELIAAWRRLPLRLRDAYPLVLCGGEGWRNQDLQEQVKAATSEGWLRHLGFVPESLIPALYAGAGLFIYPSMYEGFGLPPLEALASGVPVMVSKHSCLPEVCGTAARYFEPDDSTGFVTAIEENLTDLDWRSDSRLAGVSRAGEFGWDRCIDGTVSVYRTVSTRV